MLCINNTGTRQINNGVGGETCGTPDRVVDVCVCRLAEIKSLRAKQRLTQRSTTYNGFFEVGGIQPHTTCQHMREVLP